MAITAGTSSVRIVVRNRAAPIALAAAELTRYLARLAPDFAIVSEDADAIDAALPTLSLGTFDDFTVPAHSWPTVADSALDDAVAIDVVGGVGTIAGSNPRSVLLAAYRYLTELGCRWVRPGQDGELVPQIDLGASSVHVAEAAAYRHRGICIEGAVSYEHVRDLLDWMPKHGLNAYFMQFREAYTFFERWYAHRGNPLLRGEPFAVEEARTLKARLVEEITRRGLVFHDVGHGWTCDPLGIPGLGWEYAAPEVPPGAAAYLAEVGGRRALWDGIPLNTQVCHSNPTVRDLILGDIVAYAREHPEVDIIHFWLGDGWNNHCECAACREVSPSDWYVRWLNELDDRLTAAGLPTRIVFLIYFDLLWPPAIERLRDSERFLLMFAPITRTYSAAYAAGGADAPPALPPFVLNRLTFPRGVGENVAFLRAWQGQFGGDSFDYDYHLMWDHYKDPGGVASAEVLHADIRGLAALGLNGLISCQVQRVFFPHGLAMAVLGATLWDPTRDFRAIAEDHSRATFGADWSACFDYCAALSQAFDPPYLRGEKPAQSSASAAAYAAIPGLIAAFRPTIQRNLAATNPVQARSWHYLDCHADLCILLAEALRFRSLGDDAAARGAWEAAKHVIWEEEPDLHPALDSYEFQHTLGRLFPVPGERSTDFLPV